MSFTKAQADLLSSKFLDEIGSNPDFSDLPINETLKTLFYIAKLLIDEVNNNLNKSGNVASGALGDSFTVLDPVYEGKEIRLDIEALAYYQYLNRGVKGTKSGSGEFKFKYDKPSKDMVKSIKEWLDRGNKKSSNYLKKHSTSAQETKHATISDYDNAYAVARSIKQKGIKKNGFLDKAFQATENVVQSELGKALKIDIINSLPTQLDGTSS